MGECDWGFGPSIMVKHALCLAIKGGDLASESHAK